MRKAVSAIVIFAAFCVLGFFVREVQAEKPNKSIGSLGGHSPLENVIVYKEPGRFCGWPANYGMWHWDNEIVVGFKLGYYQAKERSHSIDRDMPVEDVMARSVNGGRTWKLEKPKGLNSKQNPTLCSGGISFTKPGFAMRCRGETFRVSYDKGKTWSTPYVLPKYGQKRIMARTDYIVNSKNDCLIFLTASKTNGKEGRPFCIRTTDGGRTLEFLSWIGPEPKGFSIMPSTVRLSKNDLICAIRRKEKGLGFIEIYHSSDLGRSWQILNKAAETGRSNGNPPSMIKLKDGRIALTYGYRSKPYGIRAKISDDNGRTWGPEIHLRDDGRTWDLGYPRTLQRPDGKIVTIYYYTTEANAEQHIAATIWDPDLVLRQLH